MSISSAYMAEPPPGRFRQETNPSNLHKDLIAAGVTTTIIALVAAVLRLFTRAYVTKSGVNYDDYMIVCAMICSLALLGCNFPHMDAGLGYHIWEVKTDEFVFPFQKWTLIGTILYATSLAFTKLSILLFYLRLSPHRWFRTLVWILIAIVVAYVLVYDIISIFGCRPIAASWDLRLVPTAICMDQLTKYMALSVLNIVIDVLTLILPIPIIMRLQMAFRQKISVCAVFATGSFVCVVAIRRTTLLKPLMVSDDYTWDAVEQFQWCFTEVNAAIVCACAPALKPFFSRYIPGLLSSHFRSHNQDNCDPKKTEQTQRHGRDRAKGHDYELQWRNEFSEEVAATKLSEADDEELLWGGDKTELSSAASQDQTKKGGTSGVYSKGSWSQYPTSPLVQAPPPFDKTKRIHVTSETSVVYSEREERQG